MAVQVLVAVLAGAVLRGLLPGADPVFAQGLTVLVVLQVELGAGRVADLPICQRRIGHKCNWICHAGN